MQCHLFHGVRTRQALGSCVFDDVGRSRWLMIVFGLIFWLCSSAWAADEETPNTANSSTPASSSSSTTSETSTPSVLNASEVTAAEDSSLAEAIVPEGKPTDVRVIIDISGSMKENDPNNLRIPALNLIVEMLPDGSQAGLWAFGQWVNMMVPPSEVDDAWRENAKEQAKKINSFGLRTNIGGALENALWKLEPNSKYVQNVILLTDGLVDIAGENDPEREQKNEAERQRILNSVLKKYKSMNTHIHTIALSDNADSALLERLSVETGGMSEVVRNSEELVKAFLKAFDQSAPEAAEQVPLSDANTFDIDPSVQEFTALIFRKPNTPPAQIVSPSGQVISLIKSAENARWFGESVYDLVTVTQPEGGTWKIQADVDPANRVTVVSDLKLEIAGLPNSLFPGQQVDFEIFLHEDGKVLSKPQFLKLMTIDMTMTAESGKSGSKTISDPNNPPADGKYRESIRRLSNEGRYELKIAVDGKTFQRQRAVNIQVRQPIGFEIRKRIEGTKEGYAVRVLPQSPKVEVAETRVIAKIKGPDQHSIIQAVPWVEEGVWESVIFPTKGDGQYEVALNIKGRMGEGQEFRIKPDDINLIFPIPADFKHEYFVQEDVMKGVEAMEPDPEPEAEPAIPEPPKSEPAIPDLANKMEEQAAENPPPEAQKAEDKEPAPEAVLEEPEEEAVPELPDAGDGVPTWVFILIPILTVALGIGGFFVYRKMAQKKAMASPAAAPASDDGMKTPDMNAGNVSLNDGMDDEDFDEDFDLSDSDEDVSIDAGAGDGEFEDLDLAGDLEDEDEKMSAPDVPDDGDTVSDEIPDFDENFDIEPTPPAEPPLEEINEEAPAEIETAEVETAEVEPPQLEPDEDLNAPEPDLDLDTEQAPTNDTDQKLDELDEVLAGLDGEPAPTEEDVMPDLETGIDETEDTADIDEALANLENELDDMDIEGLIGDEDDEKKP